MPVAVGGGETVQPTPKKPEYATLGGRGKCGYRNSAVARLVARFNTVAAEDYWQMKAQPRIELYVSSDNIIINLVRQTTP